MLELPMRDWVTSWVTLNNASEHCVNNVTLSLAEHRTYRVVHDYEIHSQQSIKKKQGQENKYSWSTHV